MAESLSSIPCVKGQKWIPRWGRVSLALGVFAMIALMNFIVPIIGWSLFLLIAGFVVLVEWVGDIDKCADTRTFFRAIIPVIIPIGILLLFGIWTSGGMLSLMGVGPEDVAKSTTEMNDVMGNIWLLVIDGWVRQKVALSWFSYALPCYVVGILLFIIGDSTDSTGTQTGGNVVIFLPLVLDLTFAFMGFTGVGLVAGIEGIKDAMVFLPEQIRTLIIVAMTVSVDLLFGALFIPSLEKAIAERT